MKQTIISQQPSLDVKTFSYVQLKALSEQYAHALLRVNAKFNEDKAHVMACFIKGLEEYCQQFPRTAIEAWGPLRVIVQHYQDSMQLMDKIPSRQALDDFINAYLAELSSSIEDKTIYKAGVYSLSQLLQEGYYGLRQENRLPNPFKKYRRPQLLTAFQHGFITFEQTIAQKRVLKWAATLEKEQAHYQQLLAELSKAPTPAIAEHIVTEAIKQVEKMLAAQNRWHLINTNKLWLDVLQAFLKEQQDKKVWVNSDEDNQEPSYERLLAEKAQMDKAIARYDAEHSNTLEQHVTVMYKDSASLGVPLPHLVDFYEEKLLALHQQLEAIASLSLKTAKDATQIKEITEEMQRILDYLSTENRLNTPSFMLNKWRIYGQVTTALHHYLRQSIVPVSIKRLETKAMLLSTLVKATTLEQVHDAINTAITQVEREHSSQSVAHNIIGWGRASRMGKTLRKVRADLLAQGVLPASSSNSVSPVQHLVEQAIGRYFSADNFYHNKMRRLQANGLLAELEAIEKASLAPLQSSRALKEEHSESLHNAVKHGEVPGALQAATHYASACRRHEEAHADAQSYKREKIASLLAARIHEVKIQHQNQWGRLVLQCFGVQKKSRFVECLEQVRETLIKEGYLDKNTMPAARPRLLEAMSEISKDYHHAVKKSLSYRLKRGFYKDEYGCFLDNLRNEFLKEITSAEAESLLDKAIEALNDTGDEPAIIMAHGLSAIHYELQSQDLLPPSVRKEGHQEKIDIIRKERKQLEGLLIRTAQVAKDRRKQRQ